MQTVDAHDQHTTNIQESVHHYLLGHGNRTFEQANFEILAAGSFQHD
jgi:hypothetical protein